MIAIYIEIVASSSSFHQQSEKLIRCKIYLSVTSDGKEIDRALLKQFLWLMEMRWKREERREVHWQSMDERRIDAKLIWFPRRALTSNEDNEHEKQFPHFSPLLSRSHLHCQSI